MKLKKPIAKLKKGEQFIGSGAKKSDYSQKRIKRINKLRKLSKHKTK